ncbi:M23 family metallopeptidase [Microbacterium sp. CPCC 204701]|uniref:M23 family metallopeptidase n=1 Tax=Microbacterium sp. CPCC 204701 TaxID=2493084 RepID=UPI000FD88DEA|nr:M23 family metallopeptidase [Microbacterium sp. CPCC 204701]
MTRNEREPAVVVEFPLRGAGWMAVTTPAARVPSHGVDLLGQRYAYDFVRVDDRRGVHVHPASTLVAATVGRRTEECYAWGARVHAPFDAEVVAVSDGMLERPWINPFREAARMLWNGLTFRPEKIPSILGNHVILRAGDVYAGFAHLAPGSVEVSAGQRVVVGEAIGRVGHTGNSTAPHLHFQLMDSLDLMNANGISCAFARYEVRAGDGTWSQVERGIPGPRERLRRMGGEKSHASAR